jgi:hypothetical protein
MPVVGPRDSRLTAVYIFFIYGKPRHCRLRCVYVSRGFAGLRIIRVSFSLLRFSLLEVSSDCEC